MSAGPCAQQVLPPPARNEARAQGLRDRWSAFRDRLVTDPRFQRWAAGFWPTRPIARRRANQLFDVVAGFVYSQVLSACVQLDLFERLWRQGPQTAAALADALAMPERAIQRLLDAAVSIQLLERRSGGRFGLGPLGGPMVGNEPLKAMVVHHAALYADLRDPVALLRGEGSGSAMSSYWPYTDYERPDSLTPQKVADYSALMTASQPLVIGELLDAWPFRRHRALLDVGGGEGRFVAAVAQRAPSLRLTLFDLPPVAALARQRLGSLGLDPRVNVVGGSFFDDPLPQGADLVTLVRVLFDHDDAHVLQLLRSVRRALPAGGTLLIAEPMAAAPGAAAMGDAYFGLYLLAMGRGRPRTLQDFQQLLQAAGFSSVRSLPTRLPVQAGIVVATAA